MPASSQGHRVLGGKMWDLDTSWGYPGLHIFVRIPVLPGSQYCYHKYWDNNYANITNINCEFHIDHSDSDKPHNYSLNDLDVNDLDVDDQHIGLNPELSESKPSRSFSRL